FARGHDEAEQIGITGRTGDASSSGQRRSNEEVSAMAGRPSTVRIHGPLQPFAQGFAADLAAQGYTEGTVMHHLYLLAHVSAWLTQVHLDSMELTRERTDEFLRDRRAEGKMSRSSPRGLAPLLQYLRGLGAAPEPM